VFLNKTTADKIIHEMKHVVDNHINIIDNNGFIIASTDIRRINNYHEAALLIINKRFKELIVEFDEQYEGCKSGVNLPIYFSNEIIGVVGITGIPEEVVKYARIIQRMTEMLVHEYFDLWNRNNNEKIKLVFINDLVSGNFLSSLFEIEDRLQKNNLDVKGTFNVALIKYAQNENTNQNSHLHTARHTIVKKYITEKLENANSLVTFNGELFIIITNLSLDEFCKELEYLCKKVQEIHSVPLTCSIGNNYDSYEDIPKSYNEAISILNYINNQPGVYQFSKTSLNVAFSKIPENYKTTLKNHVFSKCSSLETQEFIDFIKNYFLCNGSLNLLSKKYFIHKNTVQYKIQKIKEKTDYDIRMFNDMLILYLASIFYK
jgi:carbohydrate diacid regulator